MLADRGPLSYSWWRAAGRVREATTTAALTPSAITRGRAMRRLTPSLIESTLLILALSLDARATPGASQAEMTRHLDLERSRRLNAALRRAPGTDPQPKMRAAIESAHLPRPFKGQLHSIVDLMVGFSGSGSAPFGREAGHSADASGEWRFDASRPTFSRVESDGRLRGCKLELWGSARDPQGQSATLRFDGLWLAQEWQQGQHEGQIPLTVLRRLRPSEATQPATVWKALEQQAVAMRLPGAHERGRPVELVVGFPSRWRSTPWAHLALWGRGAAETAQKLLVRAAEGESTADLVRELLPEQASANQHPIGSDAGRDAKLQMVLLGGSLRQARRSR
jgi:hypothetical protein